MSDRVIEVRDVSKQYRLGMVGTGTISHDLNRWWANVRGKEDPYSRVGQVNKRDQKAESDYVWALKDINFDVHRGEILGIIGANGAGKSTLLKLMSRITAPTTGHIRSKGRIASLLEVGTGMHPEMTARENIYLNGSIMGMRRHEITRKFNDIIDFAGCQMYVDTPVKRFSSGMKVRLGFAVAAFLEPEILIVDEVLAVGDAEFQRKCLGKMQDISSEEGRTILFVSHNLTSVAALSSSSVLLENGKLTLQGRTDEAIKAYMCSSDARPSSYSADIDESLPITIRSIRLESPSAVGNSFDMMDPLSVCIACSVSDVVPDAHLSFQIRTALGQPVFTSTSADFDLHSPLTTRRDYSFRITIPAECLNAGDYELHVAPFVPGGRLLQLVEGLYFTMVDQFVGWASQPFSRPRSGCVVERLRWNPLKTNVQS